MSTQDADADAQRRNAKRHAVDMWMTHNPNLAPAVVGQLIGLATEWQLDSVLEFAERLQVILDQGVDVEIRVEPGDPPERI